MSMDACAPTLDEVGGRFATNGESIALGSRGTLSVVLSWADGGGSRSAPSGSVDLDLVAMCFDYEGNATEAVFFNRTRSMDGAIVLHSGDQRRGAIGEEIRVELSRVSPKVHFVAFAVVSASTSVLLSSVTGITITADGSPGDVITNCDQVMFAPVGGSASCPTVLVPCVLDRRDAKAGAWKLTFIQNFYEGQTFVDAVPHIRRSFLFPPDSKTTFKIPVQLHKDQAMQVSAAEGTTHVGVGWDIVNDEEADVDLSCVLVDANAEFVDFAYWGKLDACNGVVQHLGDNLTGEGDGDDEVILVNLGDLPLNVFAAVFVVSNYSDGNLQQLRNIHFRVVRDVDGAELLRFDSIGAGGSYSSFIACMLQRVVPRSTTWQLRTLSIPCGGQTIMDEAVRATLGRIVAESAAAGGALPTVKPVNLRRALGDGGSRAPVAAAAGAAGAPPTQVRERRANGAANAVPPRGDKAGAKDAAAAAAAPQPHQQPAAVTLNQIFAFVIAVLLAYIVSSAF